MEYFYQFLTTFFGSAIALGIVGFFARNYLLERFKLMLQKEHSKFVDDLQWDRKVQEQAAKVAEYITALKMITFVDGATRDRNITPYIEKANILSLELAMWLPADVYRQLNYAVTHPNQEWDAKSVVISVRELLLKDKKENLYPDDVITHF